MQPRMLSLATANYGTVLARHAIPARTWDAVLCAGLPKDIKAKALGGTLSAEERGSLWQPGRLTGLSLPSKGLSWVNLSRMTGLLKLDLGNDSLSTLQKTGLECCVLLEKLDLSR